MIKGKIPVRRTTQKSKTRKVWKKNQKGNQKPQFKEGQTTQRTKENNLKKQ